MVGLMLWVELPSWRPWFGLSIMMVKARGVKIRVESGSSWKLLILNKSGRPFHWGFRPSEFPWLVVALRPSVCSGRWDRDDESYLYF
jgi:hypothetical protein